MNERLPVVFGNYMREALHEALDMYPELDGAPVLESQLTREKQMSLQGVMIERLAIRLKKTAKSSFQYAWLNKAIVAASEHAGIYQLLVLWRGKSHNHGWRYINDLGNDNRSYHTGRCCPWGRTSVAA